jgi:hypothetical protein
MSLALSRGDPKGKGKEGWELCSSKKSEKQARWLSQPSAAADPAASTYSIHANGNTKPQEPPHFLKRNSKCKSLPRLVSHPHEKPWSGSPAPGRKENPHFTNSYHRVWLSDAGRVGRVYDGTDGGMDLCEPRRWNRERKGEHYKKYEEELYALTPHDEKFAIKTNVKFWTHLSGSGSTQGGLEKLEYVPKRGTGRHAKGSIYIGKYSDVKHAQLVCGTKKNDKNEVQAWELDTRPMFDNRLHDDVVTHNEIRDKELAASTYDLYRPTHTRSCPQMGVDYMHR